MVKKWSKNVLIAAGIYNISWGIWVILFPFMAFELTGAKRPVYPEIWQCVGMIVAVYGFGYLIASTSPIKHWPIIFVGLLGKMLGPIGFIWSIYKNIFPLSFGWNIVFNDLIWWIPFSLILFHAYQNKNTSKEKITIREDDFISYPDRKRAKLINSLSGFKSANLIGTVDSSGNTNLSIVSSLFHLGASPALIGFIIRPDTERRDTLENLRNNGFFTINHVNKAIYKFAHQTSARYDQAISEFSACGLTPQYLDNFGAPFVTESHIKIAVEMIREEVIPENKTHLIIGKIKNIHLPKDCLEEDGHININRAGTICLSGLDSYHESELISRLSYAKANTSPKELI